MIVCSRRIRALLWVGILNAAVWTLLTVPAVLGQSRESASATARAVDQIDSRVSRLEDATERLQENDVESRVAIASLQITIGAVRADVSDVRELIVTMVWAVVGFFVTVTGGLIATLWSLRKGWLRTER